MGNALGGLTILFIYSEIAKPAEKKIARMVQGTSVFMNHVKVSCYHS